eukprot:scaffold198291_cov31-Attheya_sp.AAC.1
MSGAFWSENLWLSAASLLAGTTAPPGFPRKHRMLYFPPVSRLGSSWRRPSYAVPTVRILHAIPGFPM